MRRPLILSVFRNVLSGTIFVALPCVHAQVKPFPAGNSVVPGGLLTPIPPVEAASADLPDSPGTVLRHRMQFTDESAQGASAPSSGVAADQAQAAQMPQQRLGSGTLSGAEAKASDKARSQRCPAETGAAANGIVELHSITPEIANGTSGPGAAILNPGSGKTASSLRTPPSCLPPQNPYQRFLNNSTPFPLTPRQKGYLAIHNFIDPGNIVTILGTSAITVASDSHTAYGPGWRGFGENAGISFVQDATGDFFGTFLIPSIAHEDPHYHRMPGASIPRRTLHAISRTVIAQSDDGRPIPNYSTLLTYPITAEISNLYVPGVATNGPSTVERVLIGYGTDPIDNLITEFLPDVARRVHVRVIFVQQIINQVAAGQAVSMFP